MKVWWVLAWYQYYPAGGLDNVYGTHETEEEANQEAERLKNRIQGGYDHIKVVNVEDFLGIEKKEHSWR